jgi:hypothetical protein
MGVAILWNSLVLKSTKIALFIIKPSVPISLRLYQITFAQDTDSKIAKRVKKTMSRQNVTATKHNHYSFVLSGKVGQC